MKFRKNKYIIVLFILTFILSCQEDDGSDLIISEISGPFSDFRGNFEIQNDQEMEEFFGPDSLAGRFIKIKGYLIIGEDVTSIDRLKYLYSVGDDLIIKENTTTLDLNGLQSLTYVGDDLTISSFDCSDLSSLKRLKEIGGDFTIADNRSLLNLNGLDSLHKIGYSLNIDYNPYLKELGDLSSIQSLSMLIINNCPYLEDLSGLTNVQTLDLLSISKCLSLENLNSLDSYTTIHDIVIQENDNLTEIKGLANTNWENVSIHHNAKLTSLMGLGKPEKAERVSIVGNWLIEGLDGLSNIKEVTYLELAGNGFDNFEGLSGIISIDELRYAEATNHDLVLPSLKYLNGLYITGWDATVYNLSFPKLENRKLNVLQIYDASVKFLEPLTEIEELEIIYYTLDDAYAFTELTKVGDFTLWLSNAPTGEVLFPSLETVSNFEIDASEMEDFKWVPNLKFVDQLALYSVTNLTTLSGLENLQSITDVTIKDNKSLDDFCSLKTVFENSQSLIFECSGNKFNATVADILNCD